MLKINRSLFTLLISSLLLTSLLAETKTEQGIDIIDGWQVSGDIRAGWLEYDYKNDPKNSDSTINKGHTDSKGFYIAPKLSIMSPKEHKMKAKITVAGATDFGLNDELYESRNFVFDGSDRDSFMILQEAYLSYEDMRHKLLVGREELITPMIESDDYYMLANSFELAYYTNNSLEMITFNIGYLSRMSGVWDSAENGTEFH